jgi:hypothetical protein
MLETEMESLFINKPQFEKNAGSRKFLGQDSTTWVKEIITTFLSEYPALQTEPLTVTWEATKFDKGYATGKLNIPSVGATVPLIVKEYVLMPLDTINKAGVFLPLNQYTATELFTSKQPFRSVKADPKTELTLFTGEGSLQFSPTGESTPVASGEGVSKTRDAVKVGSFIDRITNVDRSDVENMLEEIQEEKLAIHFDVNETSDVIEKLGTIKLASADDEYEALVRDLNMDISFIYEDNYGNKMLKQANSRIDYVWETQVSDAELETLNVKTADEAQETFKFAEYETIEVSKEDPTIGDCGYFKAGESKTPQVCLVNITKTADTSEKYAVFSLGKGYIALNENNDYYINDRSTVKTASAFEVEGTDPQVGDYGIWVVGNKASEPFEVESLYKSAGVGEYEIVGNRGITKIGYYPIVKHAEDLLAYDRKHNTDFTAAFYVPGNAKFVKLSKDLSKETTLTDAHLNTKIASLQNEYGLLKIAGFNATSGKYQFHVVESTENNEIEKISEYEYNVPTSAEFITVEKQRVEKEKTLVKHACGRDSAGLYYFSGPEFKKYAEAHEVRNLTKNEAIWTLLHCRGSEDDIKKLASLNNGQEFVASTNLHAPVQVKELAKTIENAVESFDEAVPLKKSLVKQAAVMTDKSTVDAILSLGLINKKNLLEYVSMIPNYEVILSQLAELLLMSRMGLAGVDQTALEDTLESMSQVVQGLKEIQGVTSLK